MWLNCMQQFEIGLICEKYNKKKVIFPLSSIITNSVKRIINYIIDTMQFKMNH